MHAWIHAYIITLYTIHTTYTTQHTIFTIQNIPTEHMMVVMLCSCFRCSQRYCHHIRDYLDVISDLLQINSTWVHERMNTCVNGYMYV